MNHRIVNLIIFVILLSGCVQTLEQSNTGISVIDAAGREITFSKFPEKIVIAGKQTPMLANFFYLFESASNKIYAIEKRSQSSDQFLELIDPEIKSKYILEKEAGAEQISPLNPDVVVLKLAMRDTIGKQLEKIGIPVVYVEFESIEQIYRDIRIIAVLLGEAQRGEEINQEYENFFNHVAKRIKNVDTSNPSVLMVQMVNDGRNLTFSVPPESWLQTNLVEQAEGIPVWSKSSVGSGWNNINFEQILVWDPEHIFVINYQGEAYDLVKETMDNEIWQNLSAVKNQKIQPFPFDFISWDQPDPRWILGYVWIGNQLFPEKISDGELMKTIKDFYHFFYQMDENTYNTFVLPKIK